MSPASYQTAPPRDVVSPLLFEWIRDLLTRAGNGTRTRDPNLGKVVLYQLSYSRKRMRILASAQHRGATIRRPELVPAGSEKWRRGESNP